MGPLPKRQLYPFLPLDDEGYDKEPCEAALVKIDEELKEEFEGKEFEPIPSR